MPKALQLEPSFFSVKATICCVSSYPADFIQLFYFTELPISDLRLTGGANRLVLPAWISWVCALSACFASDQRVPEILCASQRDHGASCLEYIDFGIDETQMLTTTVVERNTHPFSFIWS